MVTSCDSTALERLLVYFESPIIYKSALRKYRLSVLKEFSTAKRISTPLGALKEDYINAFIAHHIARTRETQGPNKASHYVGASKRKFDEGDESSSSLSKRPRNSDQAFHGGSLSDHTQEAERIRDTNKDISLRDEAATRIVTDRVEHVEVRLSITARDWVTIRKAEVPLTEKGDLCLDKVKECLALKGSCRIVDPHKRLPAWLNGSNVVSSRELSYFEKYGFIRIIES